MGRDIWNQKKKKVSELGLLAGSSDVASHHIPQPTNYNLPACSSSFFSSFFPPGVLGKGQPLTGGLGLGSAAQPQANNHETSFKSPSVLDHLLGSFTLASLHLATVTLFPPRWTADEQQDRAHTRASSFFCLLSRDQ